MEVATWLFMAAFAYGLGIFWYDLLPGKLPAMPWRATAYPFVLMVLAEAYVPVGPKFLDFHPGGAIVAGLIGCLIDWIITHFRQPQEIESSEMHRVPARP
jgi:hypothetical protein